LARAGISIVKKYKALVYIPFLTTLGGGVRYMYGLADALPKTYDVTVAGPELPEESLMKKWGFSGHKLLRLAVSDFTRASASYDLAIYLTNGTPRRSRAKQSILMVQFPFIELSWQNPLRRLWQSYNLGGWQTIVNSQFSADWLKRRWGMAADILYPPIRTGRYEPATKEKTILAVGRFFVAEHSKRQDVLIEAYRQLPETIRAEWRLVLAGGVTKDAASLGYLRRLEEMAAGNNIEFVTNASQTKIMDLYTRAMIFWHGTGYGRPANQPEKAEHFGMTTVEAMSYGCIPLAYDDGGQTEIVNPTFGYLWHETDELAKATAQLIQGPPSELRLRAERAVTASQQYNLDNFKANARRILGLE
jgi:glycosyltransferase involved in cell wall biosynthesis